MLNKKNASILALAIAMTGCSTVNDYDPKEDFKAENSKALEALVNISIETRDEMRLIAKQQEAIAMEKLSKEQHDQKRTQALAALKDFDVIIKDFSFDGPSTKATQAIAKMAGYKYKEYGKPLNTFQEPWVSIDLKDQPLSEALRELGMQTGNNVVVEVYQPAKLLRYIYKNIE